MASDYLLKHPLIWLASFPPTPSSFDREEGLVLSLRADVLVIYVFLTDTLHTLPLNTRVVKIKPVNINQYLKDLKNCFINNYDMDRTTERMLRLYIASVEEKNERVKVCVESKEEDEEEEDEEEDEYSSDDQHEEDDDEDEDESESESESESDDENEDDSSSCSSSSDEDDEDCIDFKVVIESPSMETEVRGFCMSKHKIIKKVCKILTADYGSVPILYFCDVDGDEVLIKRYGDVRFAIKSHNKMSKLAIAGSRESQKILRLHARIAGDDLNLMSTLSLSPTKEMKKEMKKEIMNVPRQEDDTVTMEGDVLLQDTKFHWQKGELVGAGSFGQVFGGILTQTGKRIAVKEVFLSRTKGHIEQAKALQVEIKILSTLEHPNIIKYLGAEFTKTTLRIFLDLASEGSLKDILNEFGALSEPLLRKYMLDILTGLNFLHSKGIIHRDIKPSNLLLDKGTVKLADFGCSATVSLSGDNDKSEVQHDTVIGTTVYMSPEIMRGSDDDETATCGYGRKTDIWSLGITFCEMATAKSPFKNAAAAIYAVCVTKEYPPLPPDMSEDAVTFLSRCLVEDPNSRADTNELLVHPFCIDQYPSISHQASNTHTLSSVALLPDFDPIDTLQYPTPAKHGGGDDNDSEEGNSFFEHMSESKSGESRGDCKEEKACADIYGSFNSDDDTYCK